MVKTLVIWMVIHTQTELIQWHVRVWTFMRYVLLSHDNDRNCLQCEPVSVQRTRVEAVLYPDLYKVCLSALFCYILWGLEHTQSLPQNPLNCVRERQSYQKTAYENSFLHKYAGFLRKCDLCTLGRNGYIIHIHFGSKWLYQETTLGGNGYIIWPTLSRNGYIINA